MRSKGQLENYIYNALLPKLKCDAQKMKFPIKDFFIKCDQMQSFGYMPEFADIRKILNFKKSLP